MLLGHGRPRHRPTPGPRGRRPDGAWRRGRRVARCLGRVQAPLAVGYCMRRSPALERLRPLRRRPRALWQRLESDTRSGRQQRGPVLGTSDWSKKRLDGTMTSRHDGEEERGLAGWRIKSLQRLDMMLPSKAPLSPPPPGSSPSYQRFKSGRRRHKPIGDGRQPALALGGLRLGNERMAPGEMKAEWENTVDALPRNGAVINATGQRAIQAGGLADLAEECRAIGAAGGRGGQTADKRTGQERVQIQSGLVGGESEGTRGSGLGEGGGRAAGCPRESLG